MSHVPRIPKMPLFTHHDDLYRDVTNANISNCQIEDIREGATVGYCETPMQPTAWQLIFPRCGTLVFNQHEIRR